MTKNFETLEVGREYLDSEGEKFYIIGKHPYKDGYIACIEDFACMTIYDEKGGFLYGHRQRSSNLITLIEPVKVVEYSLDIAISEGIGDSLCLRLEYQNGKLVKSEVRSVKDD